MPACVYLPYGVCGAKLWPRRDRLPEQVGQLRVACRAGMEAIAADVFGVRGNLAAMTEEVYQRNAIARRLPRDARVPLLDVL
ncbi:MAG TPA: hypothetical protein VNE38_00380 [Ktedonobacteraceae bacterium]|nr:hypothetical protein [Ktedonobacteraceae bacterium]